jgi:GNAT superfamily N-acetyltransferase
MMSQNHDTLNTLLTMVRDHMVEYPDFSLPPGYQFRNYRDGDAGTWTDLHTAAEPYIDITPDLFLREFGSAQDALPDRMFFVETAAGQPIGSITAWWEKDRFGPAERGRIHWVIVHPDHQGRGIAKAMMTRAMCRLRRSHHRAMLGTSSARIAAIKVYLEFGFRPEPSELLNPQVMAAWQRVQMELRHPALHAALQTQSTREARS